MLEFHAPLNEGHRGIQATMDAKKMYLHWPSMKHAIEDHVPQCMMCQKLKYDRGKLQGCYNLCWCLRIHCKVFQWTLLKSIQGNNGIWIIVACLGNRHILCLLERLAKHSILSYGKCPMMLMSMI